MGPMNPSPLKASVALAATVGLLAAGCGGDSRRAESEGAAGSTTTVASGPSHTSTAANKPVSAPDAADPQRRRYVSRVDRVCAHWDPERVKENERVAGSPTAGEAAKHYGDSIALGERQLAAIEAVPAPHADRAALKANVFDVIKQQLAVRRQLQAALAASDVPRVRSLRGDLDNLTRSLTGFARGYGFQNCGVED